MTSYIFILGIMALGSLFIFLITKNITAKQVAKIFSLTFVIVFVLLSTFIYFHTGSEDKAYLESFNKPEVKRQIESYLDTKITTANFGGKVFCSYKFLGALGIEDRDEAYIWALCEEYYLKEGVLTQGTGSSLPLAVVFKKGEIIEHKAPRDGSLYSQDIKTIFPTDVQKKILKEQDFIYDLSSENHLKVQPNLNKSPKGETASWKVYTNSQYGFEFKYPSGHELHKNDFIGTGVTSGLEEHIVGFAVDDKLYDAMNYNDKITFAVKVGNGNPENFLRNAFGNLYDKGVSSGKLQKITLSNRQAIIDDSNFLSSGYKTFYVYGKDDNYFIMIEQGSSTSILSQILNTFKIENS